MNIKTLAYYWRLVLSMVYSLTDMARYTFFNGPLGFYIMVTTFLVVIKVGLSVYAGRAFFDTRR